MEMHERSGDFPKIDLPQIDFEIEFYARILTRHPNYIEVLKRQAELLAGRHRHAEALLCDERLAAALPHDSEVHYNLACSLASLSHIAEAIHALGLAFQYGYRDFEHVESDPDLDNVRQHPDFLALIKAYRVDV